MAQTADKKADQAIEQWKVRRLVKTLTAVKGDGTSRFSLIMPAKDEISRSTKMLNEETTMYLCDNMFHTEDLAEFLESDDKFGFLIMDDNGALYGTLQGNHREANPLMACGWRVPHGANLAFGLDRP